MLRFFAEIVNKSANFALKFGQKSQKSSKSLKWRHVTPCDPNVPKFWQHVPYPNVINWSKYEVHSFKQTEIIQNFVI